MALETRKKTVGIVDPDMASTMGYLATIANLEKDYKNAQFFARQVSQPGIVVDTDATPVCGCVLFEQFCSCEPNGYTFVFLNKLIALNDTVTLRYY